MRREEALVFKVYDSLRDGRARWTAHTAFDDPSSPRNARPRESIEIRTLAFFCTKLAPHDHFVPRDPIAEITSAAGPSRAREPMRSVRLPWSGCGHVRVHSLSHRG